MIVVEIGIPSGFEANRCRISDHEMLKRTEIEDRKVILYYEEVTQFNRINRYFICFVFCFTFCLKNYLERV
jgi:hypothetical protein